MAEGSIIKDLLKGDYEAALKGIIAQYGERLFWHIRLMVNSHEDADDLMQNVYVKVWKSLPRFRGEAGLYTWLYRIATNECLNFLNRRKITSFFNQKATEEDLRKIEDDPYFNGNGAQLELFKTMAELPPKQRLVFEMRYFQDMSYEEISAITKTSVGSLKASYHIAYKKIRDRLENSY